MIIAPTISFYWYEGIDFYYEITLQGEKTKEPFDLTAHSVTRSSMTSCGFKSGGHNAVSGEQLVGLQRRSEQPRLRHRADTI